MRFRFSRACILATSAALLLLFSFASRVQADDQLPVAWNGIDIGTASPAGGSISTSAGEFTLSSGGPGFSDVSDAFHFVYQACTGDFTLTAHLQSTASNPPTATAGIMIREELSANSNFVGVFSKPDSAPAVGVRSNCSADASFSETPSAGASEPWIKLVRQGTSVRAYAAGGTVDHPGPWKPIGNVKPIATGMVFVGPFSTSGTSGSTASAIFDHITVREGIPALEDGGYTISPVSNPHLALDGSGGSGVPLSIADQTAAASQKWTITSKGNGFYSITIAGSPNLALTVANGSGQAGTKAILSPDTGLDTQLWSIVANDASSYNIYSKHDLGTGLDDLGGNTQPGQSIDIWTNIQGDPHQEWILTPESR